MKNIYCFLLVVFFSFLFFCSDAQQCADGRYLNKVFNANANITNQTPFGSGYKYDGSSQTLTMLIDTPEGDNFAHRPLMILAFGGNFTSGTNLSPDMVQICQAFAERGFVTASIDYRLGVANGADSSMYQAVIRAIQDMNAAIRFFVKDAYTTNQFRIDTNQIFCGGTSAGAFIGLNKGYFKADPQYFSRAIPTTLINAIIELGGPEGGDTANSGYTDHIKGIVDLCGAVVDTLWIQPGDPILIGVHGTGDSTVPYYYDSVEGLTNVDKDFFGGGNIIQRFHSLGLPDLNDSIYTFIGAPHAPFVLPVPDVPPASLYMDTTISILANYMYLNIACDSALIAGIEGVNNNLGVSAFPNPSDAAMTIISHEPQNLLIEVTMPDGRMIDKIDLPAYSTQTLRKNNLSEGCYLLNYYDEKGVNRLKTDKIVFY
jgi:alpha/beta superfamily hydrolase